MKRLFVLYIALVLVIGSMTNSVYAVTEQEDSFVGSREVVYSIDTSNLSNYINGGRSTLDAYLRATKPEWLSLSYKTEQRTTYLILNFSFASLSDYRNRLETLINATPIVFYTPGATETFTENVTSIQLLNFCGDKMKENNIVDVLALEEIIQFQSGTFWLNGNNYEVKDQININNEQLNIAASSLSISTVLNQDYQYERVIQLAIPSDRLDNSVKEALQSRMEKASERISIAEQGKNTVFTVFFSASDIQTLSTHTMNILNTTDIIKQEMIYLDEDTVAVSMSEMLNLSQILDRETGKFHYVFQFPQSYTVLSSEQTENKENTVTIVNLDGAVHIDYKKPFSFDEIIIKTDVASLSGRVTRTIVCKVPLQIAPYYHSMVKESMVQTLCDGHTLIIHDDEFYRYYEIQYSTCFPSQVSSLSRAYLRDLEYSYNRTWLPFGTSLISESWAEMAIPFARTTSNIQYEVLLPQGATVLEDQSTRGALTDWTYAITSDTTDTSIVVLFSDASFHVITKFIVLAIFAFATVLIIYFKTRRFIDKAKRKKSHPEECGEIAEHPAQYEIGAADGMLCNKCGAKLPLNAHFCNKCGNPVGIASPDTPAYENQDKCPKCGRKYARTERYCANCGTERN